MSCSKSNFQQDLKSDEQMLSTWQKNHECSTTKEKQTHQNQPFFEDGCFWNVNHLVQSSQKSHGFLQLDPVFEGEILRDHLQVIKVALHDYACNSNQESYDSMENYSCPSFEGQINDFKQLCRMAYDFITILKNSTQFKEEDIRTLEGILVQNPMHLRIFLIFGQAAPASAKNKLYYLIYKGLVAQQEFKKCESVSIKTLFNFLEQNYRQFLEPLDNQKDEEKYKMMALIVLYTTAMSASGVVNNQFYDILVKKAENFEKLKLTKFQRQLNSVKEKSKKVKIVRRSMNKTEGTERLPRKSL